MRRLPCLFAPTVLFLFIAIVLLPVVYMFTVPFLGAEGNGLKEFFLFFNDRHLALAVNSLVVAGFATIICLLIGVPLAFLLEKTDMQGSKLIGIAYIVPLLIPPYIHVIVWKHISHLLAAYGFPDLHNIGGAIFILSLAYFPFITLLTISGLRSIDRELEEAGLLTHTRWQTLYGITFPLIRPHIVSGAIFVFIFCLTNFSVPDMLRVRVYPVEIFIQFSAFYDERAAMILSLPLISVAFVLLFLQKIIMRDRSYVQISAGVFNHLKFSLGRHQLVAVCFCFVLLSLSIVLPIVVLLTVAGPPAIYLRALNSSGGQIIYTILLAGAGAFVTLLLSFSLSYLTQQIQGKEKLLIEFTAVIPLAIPAITLGIGLIKVWNQPVIDMVYTSSFILIFGYVAHYLPFSMLTISSGIQQLNPHLEEAALLSCCHWKQVIGKIVIPLLQPSLLAGFCIVFFLSLGDLGTTLLIIPPGQETISIKIYNFMHYGADQMVAALCLIMIAVILIFASMMMLYYRKIVPLNCTIKYSL